MGRRVRIVPVLPRDDRRRDRGGVSSDPVNPAVEAVSVFFPCYNDEATIARMVERRGRDARRGSVSSDAEVIVVNDGSTDGSAARPRRSSMTGEPLLRVVTHDAQPRATAARCSPGSRASTRQWVFYTDGDGQFDPARARAARASARPTTSTSCRATSCAGPTASLRTVIGRVYHRFVSFLFGLQHPRHRLRLPADPARDRSTA